MLEKCSITRDKGILKDPPTNELPECVKHSLQIHHT